MSILRASDYKGSLTICVQKNKNKLMPAHTKKANIAKDIILWQKFWNYFLNLSTPLFPSKKSIPNEYTGDYLVLSPYTSISKSIPSLKHFVSIILDIQLLLSQHTSTPIQSQWNYLGLNNERSNFINYISNLFWTHQSEFSSYSEYNSYVQSPWLCLNLLPLIGTISHKIPSDGFSKKSLEFVTTLSGELVSFEFNPYLIFCDNAGLQVCLTLDSLIEVRAVLVNREALTLECTLIALTDIQL